MQVTPVDLRPYIADLDKETIEDWSETQYRLSLRKMGCSTLFPSTRGLALYYNKDIFDAASVDYPDEAEFHEHYLQAMEQLTTAKEPNKGMGRDV
jgi:ABC-type glycerol-3-phosphate transport system substrate-binding protein